MYETIFFHTVHAALHALLTIDDPSRRFMRWRIGLAKFAFKVKNMKEISNQQEDTISLLRTNAENISHDDEDVVPAFLLTNTPDKNSEQTSFLNIT